MFIQCDIQLDVPFEEIRRRIFKRVITRGLDSEPVDLGKEVAVAVDRPIDEGDVVAVPVRWQATGLARLFPIMDGHVDACRLGDGRTHLQFLGRYDPPGGPVGRLIDRMALHRVAEAGARSFLHRVGEELLTANTPVAP